MKWSLSSSKIYSICHRKWYFQEIFADHNSKDPLKKETFFLKQLQSIAAWRGSLVDSIIENFIIPKLNKKQVPSIQDTLKYMEKLWNKQINFAKQKKYRNPKIVKSEYVSVYCALFDIEYNSGLNEKILIRAKKDVITSLKNLLNSKLIMELIENADYFVAQRFLSYKFDDDVRIVCVPDLIVFYNNKPPYIIDWKVHTFGNTDARQQLGLYSYILSKCNPHIDFDMKYIQQIKSPCDIKTMEYQLLLNEQREYTFSEEDFVELEDFIDKDTQNIKNNILINKKYKKVDSPKTCDLCKYKKICRNNSMIEQKSLLEIIKRLK